MAAVRFCEHRLDAPLVDARLSRLIDAWPTLDEAIRGAIVAMLDGCVASGRRWPNRAVAPPHSGGQEHFSIRVPACFNSLPERGFNRRALIVEEAHGFLFIGRLHQGASKIVLIHDAAEPFSINRSGQENARPV